MKKFIILGALLAILSLGSFDVAWAAHTVTGTTPSSLEQQAVSRVESVMINLEGTIVTPASSPLVNFTEGTLTLIVSIGTIDSSYDVNAPSPVPVSVTIPVEGVNVGMYTVEFCYVAGGVGDLHCASLPNAFEITLAGGGGGGAGPGGGGVIQEVPTRFGPIPAGPQTGSEFISTVEGLTNWIFVILLVMAVVFIVLAGFQFIAGGGDPQAVAQARQKLIWAAVGIAVAFLARGIPAAIGNLFL